MSSTLTTELSTTISIPSMDFGNLSAAGSQDVLAPDSTVYKSFSQIVDSDQRVMNTPELRAESTRLNLNDASTSQNGLTFNLSFSRISSGSGAANENIHPCNVADVAFKDTDTRLGKTLDTDGNVASRDPIASWTRSPPEYNSEVDQTLKITGHCQSDGLIYYRIGNAGRNEKWVLSDAVLPRGIALAIHQFKQKKRKMSYVAVRILKKHQNLKLRKNEFLVEFDSAELDWVFFENLKEASMVYNAWLKDRRESQDPADKYTL